MFSEDTLNITCMPTFSFIISYLTLDFIINFYIDILSYNFDVYFTDFKLVKRDIKHTAHGMISSQIVFFQSFSLT